MNLPNLTFPSVAYGSHEEPHDLRFFLYRGAAGIRRDDVRIKVDSGDLGAIQKKRIALVVSIHETLSSGLARGLSNNTFRQQYETFRKFIMWCEDNSVNITEKEIIEGFFGWAAHLKYRANIQKNIKYVTAYRQITIVRNLLEKALKLDYDLLKLTQFSGREIAKHSRTSKLNLEDIFKFGQALADIIKGLSSKSIKSPLPLQIHFRTGQVLSEWSGLRPLDELKGLQEGALHYDRKTILQARASYDDDTSAKTRYPLINLRIEAELLTFISQTSMNLAQASKLKRGVYRYQSSDQMIHVYRVYKGRRQGEAEFTIYKEYGHLFRQYLSWLDDFFPKEEERLFPFIHPHQIPREDAFLKFQAIALRCKRLGIACFKPRALRQARINWLLRLSKDSSLTAELAQHTQKVLINIYDKPHLQTALSEINRFHLLTDPSICALGAGFCINAERRGHPVMDIPKEAPSPDCINPAGCLYCEYHRDIDSFDYVWALTTYRYYKTLEIDRYSPAIAVSRRHPATLLVDRITAKLHNFKSSNSTRESWVDEAFLRMQEGRFHPFFYGLIQLMEIQK